ncbi:MAG: hypothetical protein FJ315_00125 [SAR202 cluster bacterium]|nr:hypothetical protein [SAR202 cluster bacterium]
MNRQLQRAFLDAKTRLRRSLGIRRSVAQVSWVVESQELRLGSRVILFHHQDPESFSSDTFVRTGPVR